MATILELAREVRQHVMSRDTGSLDVSYADRSVSIGLADGAVTTPRNAFLACFQSDPADFAFRVTDAPPGEGLSGTSLLLEAIEAIAPAALARVWTPYAEWKIGFRLDPEIDRTLVKEHLTGAPERLRRLMRLAISGAVTLEPPAAPRDPIATELERISKAALICDWRAVLGVDSAAADVEIKRAFRALALRFHPDRWESAPDPRARDRMEQAFRDIERARRELLPFRPAPTSEPPKLTKAPLFRRMTLRFWRRDPSPSGRVWPKAG